MPPGRWVGTKPAVAIGRRRAWRMAPHADGSEARAASPERALFNWARRRDSVELVRVVEDGRLRGARGARVVVRADRVEELRPDRGIEVVGALLDRGAGRGGRAPGGAFLRRAEERCAPELDGTPEVVQECRREQQVRAQPRVQLRGLAAEGRDADRVLEEAARVGVVPVRGGRQLAQAFAKRRVGETPSTSTPQARDGRSRRRGTRGSRPARPCRGASRG